MIQARLKTMYDRVLFCGLLGLLPLLVIHGTHLANKKHFQFFPLAWIFFAAVVLYRGRRGEPTSKLRLWVGLLSGVLGFVAAVYALIIFSPWVAFASVILLCFSWMYLQLSGSPWYQPIAWITVLCITLPLPMNLDTTLVQKLQLMSSQSASKIMDMVFLPHLSLGNSLEIETGELFVDEACSGVDSLYSLAAVGLAIVIWQQRSFAASMLTLATVPLWAWLGNVVRIFTIAFLLDRTGLNLSEGAPHMMLGLLVFAVSFSFLLATQNALHMLTQPFPVRTVASNPFHRLFNIAVCWPGKDPAAERSKKTAAPTMATVAKPRNLDLIGNLLAAAFVLVGAVSSLPILGIGPWHRESARVVTFSNETVDGIFNESLLPASFHEMTMVGFNTHHRETSNLFGEHSVVWQYRDGDQLVQVSLDFPFTGFHALEVCYTLTGSDLLRPVQQFPVGKNLAGTDDFVALEAELLDQFNDQSYLCYSNFDRFGNAVFPEVTAFNRGALENNTRGTIFQAQVLVPESADMTDAKRVRFREVLRDAVAQLLPTLQKLTAK